MIYTDEYVYVSHIFFVESLFIEGRKLEQLHYLFCKILGHKNKLLPIVFSYANEVEVLVNYRAVYCRNLAVITELKVACTI